MYNAARVAVSKKLNGRQANIHAGTVIMRQPPANKRKNTMKRLALPALAAAFAAIAHADNEAVGTPLAMPAEMQEVFARNPATASNNERFANAEAAAVYQAAHDGDLARARQILAQHPGVLQSHNTREMTPLGVAMMSGDRKAFNALLDLGADPTWLGDMRDTDLHLAAILTDRYWLDALIKRGVNLEIPNTLGETPLFAALGPETRDNFELLLKAGADIHARRTADGETLLHKASAISDYAAVPRLLKLGVDPTLRDHVGYTFQYSYFLASDNPPHAKEVRAWLDAHNIPIDTSRIAPDAPPADNGLCTVPPTALLTAVSPHYRASAALLQNSGKDNAARPADDAAPVAVSDADIDRVAQQLAAAYPVEDRAQQQQNYREHYLFYRDDGENVQTLAGALATYTLGSYNAWRGSNGDDDTLDRTYQSLLAQYRQQTGNIKVDKDDYLRHIMLGMQLILATAYCHNVESRGHLQTAGSHGLKALFKTAPERIRLTPEGISLNP